MTKKIRRILGVIAFVLCAVSIFCRFYCQFTSYLHRLHREIRVTNMRNNV